jgi:hypothetical protein
MTKRRGKPIGRKEVLSPVCHLDVSPGGRRAERSRYVGIRLVAKSGVVGSESDRCAGASFGGVMMVMITKPYSSIDRG